MVFEGVGFNVESCRAEGKRAFIKACAAAFWQDRDEADRKQLAAQAWELIKADTETTTE
ncbi:MAG: hypothetical protein LIO91_08075 [Bacteroidales bacterium]|nr:hypothetical protein [Bacteroidales bacterium]